MNDAAMVFLTSQISRLPALALYCVAIALAIQRRRTLGSASSFTVAGCSLWVLTWLTNAAFFWWQLTALGGGGDTQVNVALVIGIYNHLSNLVDALATALVLAAALRLFQGSGAGAGQRAAEAA